MQLETPRLILRVPRLADLDAFAALMADEETARFIGGVAPREVTWRALMTMIGAWHATGVSMFSVFEKATGRWVGRLGPWRPEGRPGAEVGWAIVRDCWGRGYAPEGAAVYAPRPGEVSPRDRAPESASPGFPQRPWFESGPRSRAAETFRRRHAKRHRRPGLLANAFSEPSKGLCLRSSPHRPEVAVEPVERLAQHVV